GRRAGRRPRPVVRRRPARRPRGRGRPGRRRYFRRAEQQGVAERAAPTRARGAAPQEGRPAWLLLAARHLRRRRGARGLRRPHPRRALAAHIFGLRSGPDCGHNLRRPMTERSRVPFGTIIGTLVGLVCAAGAFWGATTGLPLIRARREKARVT